MSISVKELMDCLEEHSKAVGMGKKPMVKFASGPFTLWEVLSIYSSPEDNTVCIDIQEVVDDEEDEE